MREPPPQSLQYKCAKFCCRIGESREASICLGISLNTLFSGCLLAAQRDHHLLPTSIQNDRISHLNPSRLHYILKRYFYLEKYFSSSSPVPICQFFEQRFLSVGMPSKWHWNSCLGAPLGYSPLAWQVCLIAQATRNALCWSPEARKGNIWAGQGV